MDRFRLNDWKPEKSGAAELDCAVRAYQGESFRFPQIPQVAFVPSSSILILARFQKRLRGSLQNRKNTLLNRHAKTVTSPLHIVTPQLSTLPLGLSGPGLPGNSACRWGRRITRASHVTHPPAQRWPRLSNCLPRDETAGPHRISAIATNRPPITHKHIVQGAPRQPMPTVWLDGSLKKGPVPNGSTSSPEKTNKFPAESVGYALA